MTKTSPSRNAILPVTGYLDKLSARPGETLEARVSVEKTGAYRARLLRVLCADPNPDGPGQRFEDLSHHFDAQFAGRNQPIRLGSYAEAPGPVIAESDMVSWTALVSPGALESEAKAILWHAGEDGTTVCLRLSATKLTGTVATGDDLLTVEAEGHFAPRRWHRIWITLDRHAGEIAVGACTPAHLYEPEEKISARMACASLTFPSGGLLRIATALPGVVEDHFTGKIEDPALVTGSPEYWDSPLASFADIQAALLAGWDFSVGIDTQIITPVGAAEGGMLFNVPLRAVVGARWTGREHAWRHAPAHYGAIKFHEDDLGDCGWSTDFRFTVPADLASGAYALHLSNEYGEDWLPFYVVPSRNTVRPSVVFLAPTFSYMAYANEGRGNSDEAYFERVAAWNAYPYNPDQYPVYGRSLYNLHPDESGVMFASRLRPILNMRPGFITFVDPNGTKAPVGEGNKEWGSKGSGVRQYVADTHILAWLEAKGIDFDIITDEDLDREGAALLEPYQLLLTGSHPEYHTTGTLDALQAYVRQGGRMCYLGGNGFYWRVARSDHAPGVIELRRAENGVRRWAAAPGEYYQAFDGEMGGLWKHNRRDPQQLAGAGFSAWGPFDAGHFRRTEASYDANLAWMFDGVPGETFGDYGLIGGGAAGFELDRADVECGSPEGTVVVARSEHLPPGYNPVTEDLGGVGLELGKGRRAPDHLVRADMTWFETHNGGAVFSVSSICFCGSLWQDGAFEGPVSRLLENVVRRCRA